MISRTKEIIALPVGSALAPASPAGPAPASAPAVWGLWGRNSPGPGANALPGGEGQGSS